MLQQNGNHYFLSIQNELMSILNNYIVHPATEVYEHIKKK